jgi:hypothetical protein
LAGPVLDEILRSAPFLRQGKQDDGAARFAAPLWG